MFVQLSASHLTMCCLRKYYEFVFACNCVQLSTCACLTPLCPHIQTQMQPLTHKLFTSFYFRCLIRKVLVAPEDLMLVCENISCHHTMVEAHLVAISKVARFFSCLKGTGIGASSSVTHNGKMVQKIDGWMDG